MDFRLNNNNINAMVNFDLPFIKHAKTDYKDFMEDSRVQYDIMTASLDNFSNDDNHGHYFQFPDCNNDGQSDLCHPHCYNSFDVGGLDVDYVRKYDRIDGMIDYQKLNAEDKKSRHWGQRKCLLQEMEFIQNFVEPGSTILYLGSSPGEHIAALIKMYPDLRWILMDERPPSDVLRKEAYRNLGVKIVLENASVKNVVQFSTIPKLVIMSDIRSLGHRKTDYSFSSTVEPDMILQYEICRALRPYVAMLKFKLPYDRDFFNYLDGDLFLPIWGAASTTETRLVCSDFDSIRNYDCRQYEQRLNYHNVVSRSAIYTAASMKSQYDGCYDCVTEQNIFLHYYYRYHGDFTIGDNQNYLKYTRLTDVIEQTLGLWRQNSSSALERLRSKYVESCELLGRDPSSWSSMRLRKSLPMLDDTYLDHLEAIASAEFLNFFRQNSDVPMNFKDVKVPDVPLSSYILDAGKINYSSPDGKMITLGNSLVEFVSYLTDDSEVELQDYSCYTCSTCSYEDDALNIDDVTDAEDGDSYDNDSFFQEKVRRFYGLTSYCPEMAEEKPCGGCVSGPADSLNDRLDVVGNYLDEPPDYMHLARLLSEGTHMLSTQNYPLDEVGDASHSF